MRYVALLSLLFSSLCGANSYSVKADYWYPYNGIPGELRPGYVIEIMQSALKDQGHSLSYELEDWETSLALVGAGKDHCVVGALKNEAQGFVYNKEPIGYYQAAFFGNYLQHNWKYTGNDSLKSMVIGVIEGYSYTEALDDYIQTYKDTPAVYVATGDLPLGDLIKQLKAKKIDLIVESPEVFNAELKRLRLKFEIEKYGMLGDKEPLYIACSPQLKASNKLVNLFDYKIQSMRKNGSLKKLLRRYGVRTQL